MMHQCVGVCFTSSIAYYKENDYCCYHHYYVSVCLCVGVSVCRYVGVFMSVCE